MAGAGVVAIISAVSAAGSVAEGQIAADAREKQLQEGQRQQQLLSEQQTGKRLSQIKDVIETQSIQAAARGISTSSPSFTAIEQDSVNNYSTSEKLSNIESNARIAGLQSQIDATQTQAGISLFTGAVQVAGDAAGYVTTQQTLNQDPSIEDPTDTTQQVSNAAADGVAPPSPYQQHINQQQFGESFGEENFARIGLFGESE